MDHPADFFTNVPIDVALMTLSSLEPGCPIRNVRWPEAIHPSRECQAKLSGCRGKMRMSGLCKVEMSGFIQGGRQDGTGANRVECERTGAAEGVTRSRARPSEAGGSGATSATD